ncbi:MAG TPA: CARDB domain-containing protein [Pyrinomonadaceae bacterium]|nr:CARDB domain-containing protein [Pyrinomonadaceae bacterium]
MGAIYSFDANGQTVSGWPISIPGLGSVIQDPSDGTIFARGENGITTFSIYAIQPNGVQKWRRDYPGPEGGRTLVQTFNGAVATVAANTKGLFMLDRMTGQEVCSNINGGGYYYSLVGDANGLFTPFHSKVTSYNATCGMSEIFQETNDLELRTYDGANIYGFDYPVNPFDPNQEHPIAISQNGSFLWRQANIKIDTSGILSVKNGILYVIGRDVSDSDKNKLFLLNKDTGTIADRLDLAPYCTACGFAVTADGTMFLNDQQNRNIFKVERVVNPTPTPTPTPTPSPTPTPGTTPVIQGVTRTLTGRYFLQGLNESNIFDLNVNWNGSPGLVRFQVNNSPTFDVTGNSTGASHAFNMNTAFTPSFSPSIITMVPINAQSVVGSGATEALYVFPFPSWLQTALNLDPGALNSVAAAGEVRSDFKVTFPARPFRAKVTLPSSLPYIGGPLGIKDTFVRVRGFATSAGNGSLTLAGGTGFQALQQEAEVEVSGTANVSLRQPGGLNVTSGSFNARGRGVLSREEGIISAIPALSAYSGLPVIKQFNNVVRLRAELRPTVDFGLNFKQDSAGNLNFVSSTGQFGMDLRAVLMARVNDHISAQAWVSGGGTATLGYPAPILRNGELKTEAGIKFTINYLINIEQEFKQTWKCSWVQNTDPDVDPIPNCFGGASFASFRPKSGLALRKHNYSQFGRYEDLQSQTDQRRAKTIVEKAAAPSVDTTIVANVFAGAEPKVVSIGASSKLLLWVRQNPSLPILQSTEIAWSRFDGTTWSSPSVIVSDTRAEASPVASVDSNGKIVAAWTRVKSSSFSAPITTIEQLPDFYKQFEVVSSVFDPASASWGPVTSLTDDLALDTSLRLSADRNGKLLLTWQSNPSGEFSASAGAAATLKFSVWSGSGWSSPGSVATNLVNISEHTAAINGNSAFVIVPQDPDLSVPNDRRLLSYTWNGSSWTASSVFAGGSVDNLLPSAVYDLQGNGQVIWLRGADLVQASLSNPVPAVVRTASNSSAFFGSRLLIGPQGNLTLVWQEVANEGPANIFAAIYDSNTNTWSEDIKLNEDDWQSSAGSPSFDSLGVLNMAYLATQIGRTTNTVTIDGETFEVPNIPVPGQTDIRLLQYSLTSDLSVTDDDLALSPALPVANEVCSVTVKIHNPGAFPLNNFSVSLYGGGNSTLLATSRITEALPGGAARDIVLIFIYPATTQNLSAVVDSDLEINEFSETNNRADLRFSVSLGGRVFTTIGRGVKNAKVHLIDPSGLEPERIVVSDLDGFYKFENVVVGKTYSVRASQRRFTFPQQLVTITEALANVNFEASP